MKPILALPAFACALVLTACATAPLPKTAEPTEYQALVAKAEQEIRRADELGFLWLHTEKYLAESRKAQATGDVDKAMKLAQQALQEALLAQKQAADNANVKADYTFSQ